MRRSLLFIAICLALSCLLLNSLMMYFASQKFNSTVELRHHYRDQAKQIVVYLSHLIDAESAARGYIITNDENYLEPYKGALDFFNSLNLKEFIIQEHEDPLLVNKIEKIESLQVQKLQELQRIIDIKKFTGFEQAKNQMLESRGEALTDQIRELAASVIEDQDGVLREQSQEVEKDFAFLTKTVIFSNLLYFLVFCICILFLYRDIEKRIKTEERLESINHLQDIVLKTVKQAIITLDLNGKITSFNHGAQVMFGYTQDQVLGLPVVQLFEETENRLILQNYSERFSFFFNSSFEFLSFLTNNHLHQEYICHARKKTGGKFFINLNMTALTDRDEGVHGYLVEGSDVTERKKWEEKLIESHQRAEQANEAKSKFMANISHDLRTPLTSIIGFSYIFEKKKVGDTITQEDLAYVSRIEENGKLLLNLINAILELDRIERKEIEIKISPVDFGQLLQSIVNKWEAHAIKKGLIIQTQIPENLEKFYTDEPKISQILSNLIENAIKFTQQGTVSIILKKNDKTNFPTQVDIVDTGIGIQETELSKMFIPFSQLSGSMRTHYGGSGLGLSMSKQLCDLLGYRLIVSSEYGKGSSFTLILTNSAIVENRL